LLPKTLDSIQGQSFTDFEWIISDDCSTDNTQEICLEYARHDSRIKYFRNDHNLGMPGNLNVSLKKAQGNYLANLHDGDVYRSGLIEKWKKALDDFPTAGFVFNAYRVVNEDGSTKLFRENYQGLIPGQELLRGLLSQWGSSVFGTVMTRRSAYERVGWFDPLFGNFSDVDMWMRLAAVYDVAYVNEPLMDLMPRDPTRFYAIVHWQVAFWILGIHTTNLERCRQLLPDLTKQLEQKYRWRRFKYLGMHMLLCLKHRRWDRAKEGLAIWRDADDWLVKSFGQILGRREDAPQWYDKHYWERIRLSTV
jgi:glycosyltransferase involved in cell wall biosynthesis